MNADAIRESDEAFRAQFDPNSPTFHNAPGGNVPVALGCTIHHN
jgi:hypothetical protein